MGSILGGREGEMGVGMGLADPAANYGSILAVGLFVALMCVCIVLGHLLEENRWMNDSITTLFIVSPSPPLPAVAALRLYC